MIPLFAVHMPESLDEPLLKTLHSGYIGQGPRVDEFERKLGQFIGCENIITTSSGTAALQLALRICRIGGFSNGGNSFDEVITTPMTCTATNLPILAAGAIPVWADVHHKTGLIDEFDVERKITNNTRAIICVHWGGTPCNMPALRNIASKYGLILIEDAAHAFGAIEYGTQSRIGCNTADITMFSFQAIKHISTVDGGALSIRDDDLYQRAKLERWYGIDRNSNRGGDSRIEEDIVDWGLKWHMNDVAATIGIEQLNHINDILSKHRNNARKLYYGLNKLKFAPAFPEYMLTHSAFWLFTVLLYDQEDRERFRAHAQGNEVQVSRVHARNDTHTVFKPYAKPLPGVELFNNKMICLPVHWKLSEADLEKITITLETYQ